MYDSTDKLSFIEDTTQAWSPKIIAEVRQKKYIAYQQGQQQIVGIYYKDNQGNFVILASAADTDGQTQKKNLLQIMGALFIVQILIQFAAGRWFAQRAFHPIQVVNAQVQKISATDLHLRVNANNEKDEIGQLAAHFNSLLERLETSFGLQKMFVANASHELKTPVTNIIGEIEVAVSKDRYAIDYQQTLQSVLVEAERLHHIIDNFLMLANAENNFAMQQTEPVRLDELLFELKEAYIRQQSSVIDLQLSELPDDESRLYFTTNKTLLIHVINNIIQNGLKFSGGQIVICSLHFTPSSVIISISDKGIGIDADKLQHIFEPFFRSPDAGNYEGHGIGLYIAFKITALLGGKLTVESAAGAGSTFNIIFRQKD